MIDFNTYIDTLDNQIKNYMPQHNTPLYDALVKPKDIFRIPLPEAEKLQFSCIKQVFMHHYNNNKFYHKFCKEQAITPDDIKTNQDLTKIPLIPDKFFKDYPVGKDFALWLANIYTGELPNITVRQNKPTYDDVIKAFYEAGVIVSYSSGTGGRYTFIPRNKQTFLNAEYALAKSVITMAYPLWKHDSYGYLLMPNPKKNFIFAGKALEIYYDAVKDVKSAIDREVTTELVQMTMGNRKGLKSKIVRYFSYRQSKKMVDNIISWLEKRDKAKDTITLLGAPYILYSVMEKLKREGKSFDFGERGGVANGGGWKGIKNMSHEEFRKEIKDVLGIPGKFVLDVYSMVEGNGWMIHCPEGHYLHAPYAHYKPLVLDKDFKSVGYGEWGRFAFLDGISTSHPSFIVTGDQVKLLEHCPVCDRPGPVLEPVVKRVQGEDIRGCAEEVRRMLSKDLG
jgi:phenylacetate-coenzyme A ligase PaaK-like adenylate-forming protein